MQSAPLVTAHMQSMISIPLVGVFGYTRMPGIWNMFSKAISYMHSQYPVNWKMEQLPLLSYERQATKTGLSDTFVDDTIIIDYEERIEASRDSFH